MKSVVVLIAAWAFALSALAQAQKPAPKEEAAKPAPVKEARKASPKRHEDARHCLDKGNNTDIIKCAEAYL
jgi:hypothetical protein